MKKKKKSMTTPLIAATIVFLIAANILLGVVLMHQSRSAMQSLIRARMLDIANTAASMLDGDVIAGLTENDKLSPEYQQVLSTLRTFKDNIELEYIYTIRDEGGRFSFMIDSDYEDPGDFGDEISYTKALNAASLGTPSVDEEPYSDRWGRFYSAYSPIFDSKGHIAGIVAVDFSASWYEDRVKSHLVTVIVIVTASTVVSILMAFTVSSRLRRRFNELYTEMNSLAQDFDDLNRLIRTDNNDETANPPEPEVSDTAPPEDGKTDEISMLGEQIRSFQKELRQYLTYVHSQAYTDSMTGVGSKTAYLKKVKYLDKQIENGTADFAVAVFDMNGLKAVNDNYGHEMGDKFIIGAAKAIKTVFGSSNVYRIGGDEFIAVVDNCTRSDIEDFFLRFDSVTRELNSGSSFPVKLTIAKGAEVFSAERDAGYNKVFKRADEAMYKCKCDYYHKKNPGTEV